MKKLLFITCFYLSTTFYLSAQNIYPPSGNVGFGTTSPSKELEIRGGDGVGISLYNDQANYWDILNSQYGKLDFVRGKSNIFMRITQNGYVGIGTTTPSHLFSLGNNTNNYNLFRVDGIFSDVLFNGTHTNGNIWSFINSGTGSGTRFYVEDANNSSSRLTFNFKGNGGLTNILAGTSNGKVGIGTTTPDAKLTVKGNIHTNEVKVDLLGAVAPDYVFYKDYDLKTLQEVENYISEKGHLPNIPSAKQMEAEGIKLKEMNLKLLEKIEELTLYTISQEKETITIKKELQDQKTINKNLETRLQKIETLLNSIKQ